ncbi:MAG: hypothetical protein LBQ57_00430 [Spirochaetales bacterium]|jgi:hypothetical protein|nr:hypothetical protein [Spirochaetales bacterium]
MKYRHILPILLGLAAAGLAWSADFGLLVNAAPEYISDEEGKGFNFTGSLTPWFSAAPGEKISLYLSGKITQEYEYETKAWTDPVLFELERTELNFRPAAAVYLSLGRQRYTDSAGMIASGLFDGLSASVGLGGARLFLGGFYTGFLYKETAEILMTPADLSAYAAPLSYDDFDTYFASRRFFVPLTLELPDLTPRLNFSLTALAQFDLNNYEEQEKLHNQYLEARFGLEAADSLRFALTGIGALAQPGGEDADAYRSFAAALEADWDVPGDLTDMFSAQGRWANGAVDSDTMPFLPISGVARGFVFGPVLSGLLTGGASYTARLHRSVSLSVAATAFWRTDLETIKDIELDGTSKDRFLGWETCAELIWAPQSAIHITAGGGAFFPGGAFIDEAKVRWRVNTGVILSF